MERSKKTLPVWAEKLVLVWQQSEKDPDCIVLGSKRSMTAHMWCDYHIGEVDVKGRKRPTWVVVFFVSGEEKEFRSPTKAEEWVIKSIRKCAEGLNSAMVLRGTKNAKE